MLWNWLNRHPRVVDVLLVAALVPVSVQSTRGHHSPGAAIFFAFLAALPLLARRRYPLATLALVLAATVAGGLVLHRTNQWAATLAVFTVAVLRERDVSFPAAAL